MKRLLERARLLAVVGVAFLLLASLGAFLWGGAKTIKVLALLVATRGGDATTALGFVQVVDAFLLAAALLIFALSLYELFVGALDLPPWMAARDLHGLKANLASVIVLLLAGEFLERLVGGDDARATLETGAAVALVSLGLVAFIRFHARH